MGKAEGSKTATQYWNSRGGRPSRPSITQHLEKATNLNSLDSSRGMDKKRTASSDGCTNSKPNGSVPTIFDFDLQHRHGHVTALTVGPSYRRLGVGQRLMQCLEDISLYQHDALFVDLFVRPSNRAAIAMYERLGYGVWRRLPSYYSHSSGPVEDAFDMRKVLV